MDTKNNLIKILDKLIQEGQELRASYIKSSPPNFGGGYIYKSDKELEIRSFLIKAIDTVERIAGKESRYLWGIIFNPGGAIGRNPKFIDSTVAALDALKSSIDEGIFFFKIKQFVCSEVFDDFLNQADFLLSQGYHIPAMVLGGAVLEDHLAKLCEKHIPNFQAPVKPSIFYYNDKLKDNVYDKLIWEKIKVSGRLRNYAAHGERDEKGNKVKVDPGDINEQLTFIRDFIAKHSR